MQLRRSGPGALAARKHRHLQGNMTSTHARMHKPAVLPTAAQGHMVLVVKRTGQTRPSTAQLSTARRAQAGKTLLRRRGNDTRRSKAGATSLLPSPKGGTRSGTISGRTTSTRDKREGGRAHLWYHLLAARVEVFDLDHPRRHLSVAKQHHVGDALLQRVAQLQGKGEEGVPARWAREKGENWIGMTEPACLWPVQPAGKTSPWPQP